MSVTKRATGEPFHRSRITQRAITLQTDRSFLADLDRARRHWNQRWSETDRPGLMVWGTGSPPERVWYFQSVVIPPGVAHDRDQVLDEDFSALMMWRQLSSEIAEKYWPEENFPPNESGYFNPAINFVSLCLIYNPVHVSPEWVMRDPIQLRSSPARPTELASALWVTLGRLRDLRNNLVGMPGETEMVAQLADTEEFALRIAGVSSLGELIFDSDTDEVRPDHFFYVPLSPVLSGDDLKAAAPAIMADLHKAHGGDFLFTRVQVLRRNGLSHARIAQLLGVNRSTVSRLLKQGAKSSDFARADPSDDAPSQVGDEE